MALVVAGCGGKSKISAKAKGVTIEPEENAEREASPIFIPNVFHGERIYHQSHSVLILAADRAVSEGKEITRVFSVETQEDLVDAGIFKESLAIRLPLSVPEIRSMFVYGDNTVRLEMADLTTGNPTYGDRRVVLQDFPVAMPMQNMAVMTGPGVSGGEISLLSTPVQMAETGVLTTGYLATVFQ